MRYYYDCPIDAAYMAKHFGFKFRYFLDMEENIASPESGTCLSWYIQNNIQLEIHPDSLKFLEPQIGDIVEGDTGDYYCNGLFWWSEYSSMAPANTCDEILQRNGRPFITPKREAA